jgi:hypothetical protein
MLVINSIDKTRLSGDGFSYSGDGVAWKARVVLFMGFAAMAGGLAGGVCVMVLKYVVNESVWPSLWMGVANVVANALVMLRYVVVETCRVRTGLVSSMLTLLQLCHPVGEPEHGGRLHVQPCLVRVGRVYCVQCTIFPVSTSYRYMSVLPIHELLRASVCRSATPRPHTFTCKTDNDLHVTFSLLSPTCRPATHHPATHRPATHRPATQSSPFNSPSASFHTRETTSQHRHTSQPYTRKSIQQPKSNSTERDSQDLPPSAPWTTTTTTTTPPPLPPKRPSTMLT